MYLFPYIIRAAFINKNSFYFLLFLPKLLSSLVNHPPFITLPIRRNKMLVFPLIVRIIYYFVSAY